MCCSPWSFAEPPRILLVTQFCGLIQKFFMVLKIFFSFCEFFITISNYYDHVILRMIRFKVKVRKLQNWFPFSLQFYNFISGLRWDWRQWFRFGSFDLWPTACHARKKIRPENHSVEFVQCVTLNNL